MNSDNRNKVLIGFGALAVVLIAAIALWPPTFRSEEASGAIGAVQKHRAPQIAQKDVILGNEATRHQQKVLYGDFFSDAQKLQDISAKLATVAATHGDASEAAQAIKLMVNELNGRYRGAMNEALTAVEAANQQRGSQVAPNLQVEAAEIAQKLHAEQLSSDEMSNLTHKFVHQVTETMNKSDSQILQADRDVEAAAAESGNNVLAVQKLQAAETSLAAQKFNEISFADREDYMAQIAANEKVLAEAQQVLAGSVDYNKFLREGEAVASRADKLQQIAIANINGANALYSQTASALKHMDNLVMSAEFDSAVYGTVIAAIKQELKDREPEFAANAGAMFAAEVAEIQQVAESRMRFAKFSGGEQQLQAAAAGEAQAESRKHLFAELSNVEGLRNEAAAIGKILATGDLAAIIANQEGLKGKLQGLEVELGMKHQY